MRRLGRESNMPRKKEVPICNRYARSPRSLRIWVILFLVAFRGLSCIADKSQSMMGPEAQAWWTETGPTQPPATRHLSVEDMIRFATIGDPESLTWMDYERQISDLSPDGEHVAIVIRRGNPERETTEGALLIYRTADLLSEPKAEVLAQFFSATNFQPIAKVRWLDNKTVVFAATRGEDPSQIYRADIVSRRLTQLTHEPRQPKWYDISPSGERLVVFSALPKGVALAEDPQRLRRGIRITADSFYDADTGTNSWDETWGSEISYYNLRTGTRKTIATPDHAKDGNTQCFYGFTGGLSPDGRFGLQVCKLNEWPKWWSEYKFDDILSINLKANNTIYARQWFLFDLEAGIYRPLTGAPCAPEANADPVWIEGGRRVVLAGAVEPLNGAGEAERERRASSWGVLAVDLVTSKIERIAELPPAAARVMTASWDEPSLTLTVETADEKREALPKLMLRHTADGWIAASAGSQLTAVASNVGVRLLIQQSPNDRPVLMAEDLKTGKRNEVLDPNPWLAQVKLGRVEEISWITSGKRAWYGTLYYPVEYVKGERYPLVLQTHGMRPGEYSLDGYVRNFAAQPMAARGLMVLQIAEGRSISDVISTPGEWPTVRAGLEGAIDFLNARQLIDRTRVGTVGWSRTGPHTGYALTHSSYPFAAAMMMDTSDFGWFAYFSWGDAREFDLDYGSAPFGKGLESWLEIVPSFNLERIRTPLLMWNAGSAIGRWDWYAGLRRLGKPVEYWIVPDGTHDLFIVGQRLLINRLTVDWFDFWLNGHEDTDPAKADQYARWRALREQQKKVIAEPRPPLYDWSARPIQETVTRRSPTA